MRVDFRKRLYRLACCVACASSLVACSAQQAPPAIEAVRPASAASQAPPADETVAAAVDGAACYSNQGGNWARAFEDREAQCFERDSCSGGLGDQSDDGEKICFKWALGADAPALPWSKALITPPSGQDVPPPKDLYAGSYEMTSDCHEKGCAYGSSRYLVATKLYAAKDASQPPIATIPVGECVDTETDALLQAPRRGVVLETRGRFEAGDIIYLTSYEGEGYSTIWRRGEYLGDFQDEAVVRWDPPREDPRAGYWVEVKRTNGQGGWVRDAEAGESDCDPSRR